MKINFENYESYFLDYCEGNLSEPEVVLLQKFCNENNIELIKHDIKSIVVNNKKLSLVEKLKLSKFELDPNINKLEALLIGEVENTNTETEKQLLQDILQNNSSLLLDLNAYKATVLHSKAMLCPDKESLMKPQVKTIFNISKQWLALAATILLAIAVGTLVWYNDIFRSENTNNIAHQTLQHKKDTSKQEIISNDSVESNLTLKPNLAVQNNQAFKKEKTNIVKNKNNSANNEEISKIKNKKASDSYIANNIKPELNKEETAVNNSQQSKEVTNNNANDKVDVITKDQMPKNEIVKQEAGIDDENNNTTLANNDNYNPYEQRNRRVGHVSRMVEKISNGKVKTELAYNANGKTNYEFSVLGFGIRR